MKFYNLQEFKASVVRFPPCNRRGGIMSEIFIYNPTIYYLYFKLIKLISDRLDQPMRRYIFLVFNLIEEAFKVDSIIKKGL